MTVDTSDITVAAASPGQVIAAREYIRRIGGPELVSERIVKVASLPLDEVQAAWAKRPIDEEKIQAAQILIRLRGGEKNVEPRIVAIAHAKPGDPMPKG